MAERLTTNWRHGIAEEAEELLTATNAVLDAFEHELPGLGEASDEPVFAVVERFVLALNEVNDPTTAAPSKPTNEKSCAISSTSRSPSTASMWSP
ncbi:hypothetical protein ACFV46_05400 [Streptomyces sp. NPDC059852]|uniref:hypothetical protein n=1 Tax=Streptomyces sp. NPDC059852 TaxID=3346972 RepID=UPI00365D8A84